MNELKKTLCVSFPRSGHNLLVSLLLKYFSRNPKFPSTLDPHLERRDGLVVADKFVYCENYSHCGKFPCTDHRVNFMKNHDFEGTLNPGKIGNTIVQYRHPLNTFASYFEFQNKGLPREGDEWEAFCEECFSPWEQFVTRWVLTKREGTLLYLKYEDLIQTPLQQVYRVLLHMGEKQPELAAIQNVVKSQRVWHLNSNSKLSAVPERWIRDWEDRNADLLNATGVTRLFRKAGQKKREQAPSIA